MHKRIWIAAGAVFLLIAGLADSWRSTPVAHAQAMRPAAIPKSYGRLVTAYADSIGTGLAFEDSEGVIRFVSVTGMKEGQLERYEKTPVHGGIPKSYGHLVSVVVNGGSTGLIFEDVQGVIRFVTLAGVTEQEMTRQ